MAIKDWKENRNIEFVSSILHIITIMFALLSYTAAIMFSVFYIPSVKSAVIGAAIATFSTILLYGVFRKIAKNQTAKQTDWNPWIYIESRHVTVKVDSPEKIIYSTKLVLKILNHDVSRLNWRMGWSGEGAIEVDVKNKGFQPEIEPSPYDISKILRIYFDRPFNKGEKLELNFDIVTEATVPAKPFYSLTFFDSRTPKDVIITVTFSGSVVAHSFQKAIYASDIAAWPMIPPEPAQLDEHKSVTWRVPPVYGKRCCISWEYEV